jgi:hypothetical protein
MPNPYQQIEKKKLGLTGGNMGLAIGVGVLADLIIHDEEGADWMRKSVSSLNKVLAERGMVEHSEPERIPACSRRSVTSYPYSFLHYLRRAFACVIEGKKLRIGEMKDADFDFVQDVTVTLMDSHLLSHSDAEGYYLPRDFRDPLCDDRLPGGFAGSLPQLLRELEKVAPALDIHLVEGRLLPADENKLADVDEADPLYREKIVWFSLYEAAHLCLKHGTLLVFH